MWYILLAIVVLGFIAAILGKLKQKTLQKQLQRGEIDKIPETTDVDSSCCGAHEVCEKESLLAAVSQNIVYYDDDELDRFSGRASDSYSEAESNEFEEVFYTLREVDVAGWVRSLQLRCIELPDQLKDEVILIIGERRSH